MKTSDKGDIGVAHATADLIEQGWHVLLPVSSISPFDLVAYKDARFLRVQVKYAKIKHGTIRADCRVAIINRQRIVRRENQDIDVVCIYCPDNRTCYYVQYEKGRQSYSLRLHSTLNNQIKNVNFAALHRRIA